MQYNFVKPKTPTYNKGLMVIDSDDGKPGDYSHWLPLMKRKSSEWNQWIGASTAVFCPAVHAGATGRETRLSQAEILELQDYGCEIMSHGYHHMGLGKHQLKQAATAGDTNIYINFVSYVGPVQDISKYTFKIYDGTNSENVVLTDYTSDYVVLQSGLVNSYGTDAYLSLTTESITTVLQDNKTALESMGVNPVNHHVFTYHSGSEHNYNEEAINLASQYFVSARGRQGRTQSATDIDVNNLKCQLNTTATNAEIDTILDDVAANDLLFIYYGHAETAQDHLDKLEYVIDGALSRGIRITTRTDALQRMGVM